MSRYLNEWRSKMPDDKESVKEVIDPEVIKALAALNKKVDGIGAKVDGFPAFVTELFKPAPAPAPIAPEPKKEDKGFFQWLLGE